MVAQSVLPITPVFITSPEQEINSLQFYETKVDLYKVFRPYLIFGKLLGIVPIEKLFQRDVNNLSTKKLSFGVLFNLSVIASSFLWMCLAIIFMFQAGKRNATEIAYAASPGIYCLNGVIIYGYFLWNGKSFANLFKNWNKITFYFCKEDTKLSKDIAVITTLMFASGVLENVVLQLTLFPVFNSGDETIKYFNLSKNSSALEIFYYREFHQYRLVFPYNPSNTIFLFVMNKLILYAWNYTDILIILISRAFYHQFNSLIEIVQQKISSEKDINDPAMWKSLILDHNKLSDILEEFQNFLSPLVFLSYALNTFYSCVQFNLILTSTNDISLGKAIFSVWSFGQLMMRVLVVTIFASRVHESAYGILNVLYQCPSHCYSPEVERTEKYIQYGRKLGFHGLGCFHITKSLYLSFLSVLLTFEIVLLQSSSSTPTCPTH